MGKKKKNNHFNLPTLAFTDEMESLKGCLLLLISCFYLEMLLCMRSDACAVRAGAGERAGRSAVDCSMITMHHSVLPQFPALPDESTTHVSLAPPLTF